METNLEYVKGTKISLKGHPNFDEFWVKNIIINDPSILGLGDLMVKDTERIQNKAGRLDLLLQDPETDKRYEIEIMLGKVDESHIIRTIEYWDIERKRYPNYEHCAVLIAEEITSRFLNVISLFNSMIPIIALQMNAIQIDSKIVLNFTRVLDEIILGEPDDDEELSEKVRTDRQYWNNRGSDISMKLADECLELLKEINPDFAFNYNKFYIGLKKKNRKNNFIIFKAKKTFLRLEIRISESESFLERLKETDIEIIGISKRTGRLRLSLHKGDISSNKVILKDIFEKSYKESIE
ncbi:MAG: hypothetical protein D6830_04170 [Ignavibacteria bacterium]|nr:MAG: hypothetical protein D6830_04170 [Ignavibacteria bacterium]